MPKNILIPVSLQNEASWREVFPTAAEYARNSGATLHVMAVAQHVEMNMPGVPFPEDFDEKLKTATRERLEALAKEQIPADIKTETIVGQGRIYREILRIASRIKADLIIMASHKPSFKDYLLSANAASVVRYAECSVYIVRPKRT